MLRIKVLCVAAIIVYGSSAGVNAQRGVDSTAVILRRLYQRFLDGIRTRDTLVYRDLLTPDYAYAGDSGVVTHDRSARLKRDMANPDRYEVFEVERCELSVQSASAVGPCWYHARGMSSGQHGDWHGVSMLTFVRTG